MTGQADEWPSPGSPKSQPYAISEIHGAIWYVETAGKPNALVRFDEASHAFQTWPIPRGGGVVRNMMPRPDGYLVMTESGVNRVALVPSDNQSGIDQQPWRLRRFLTTSLCLLTTRFCSGKLKLKTSCCSFWATTARLEDSTNDSLAKHFILHDLITKVQLSPP
jgi:hypothetical protein